MNLMLPTTSEITYLFDGCVEKRSCLQDVIVFPGAFNPLHEGHRKMKNVAEQKLQRKVVFEISLGNVDKATLNNDDLAVRLQQFKKEPVVLSNAPLFTDKSRFFPGCVFLIGFDTACRILDSRYYQNEEQKRDLALASLLDANHRFLVAGRVASSEFRTLETLNVPDQFLSLFDGLTEAEFRVDVSSTAIRSANSD